MSIVGLMFGCLLGGMFVGIGRKKAAILANSIVSAGSLLCLIENFYTIMVGKVVFGFGSGLLIVACGMWNKETIPASKMGYVGTSINFGIVFGLLVSTTVQNISLADKASADYITSKSWMWPMGSPALVASISTLLWLILFEDSIDFQLEKGNEEGAKVSLCKVY